MPNHFHSIIGFSEKPQKKDTGKYVDLPGIIGYFKAYTQKLVREKIATAVEKGLSLQEAKKEAKIVEGLSLQEAKEKAKNSLSRQEEKNFNGHKIRQKSFYEHIIRNEEELERIQTYIINNPFQWDSDTLKNI